MSTSLPAPPDARADLAAARDFLAGGGEAGALMRALDWSQTPLGPPSTWAQSLRAAVQLILGARHAMLVWWGRELVSLYNDASRPILGGKHPCVGRSAREVWAEAWDEIGPRVDAVLTRGEATYDERLRLLLDRRGSVEEAYLTLSCSPLLDDRGGVGGVFCALTEETERVIRERRMARAWEGERRRAEGLAELDRAKTTFFSNVSHELRTPLTLVLGPLEDALAVPALPEVARAPLLTAHRNSLRLLRQVNTLLDFARIEAGRVQVSYEPMDLALLTAELASVFRSAVERAGLTLEVDCPPLPQPAWVDRDMWEKIVLNLISNALKFTFKGRIRVALRADGDAAELTVLDTGVGIAEADQRRLFERFYRVEGARGRTQEGTGIGLALVQELTRLHGGTVSVRSAPGQGSTFTVRVPLGAAHLPKGRISVPRLLTPTAIGAVPFVEEALCWLPEPQPGPRPRLYRRTASPLALPAVAPRPPQVPAGRLLIADDNADMREYLRRLLGSQYALTPVADGEAALAAARRSPPDLLIADVMMPRLDGFALLRALRAAPETATIPVILLSARAGEESRVEGLAAGADDYMVKPFSARELLARVEAHLRLGRLRRDTAEALRAGERQLRLLLDSERAARSEAERANHLKDEFLAVISHELRTPLNAILGWTQMLRRGTLPPSSAGRALEVIERNTLLQSQLIADLLDVSRITSGKLALERTRADLTPSIEAALEAVRQAAASKEIRLERRLEPAAWVLGDPARLQQVVCNLVSNAVKFSARGGRVEVRLVKRAGWATVSVRDEGQGIRPEFLPHVFDRFRQADSSAARQHGGLGLGLSIVKHLVEAHGGEVEAESAGEGHGATFRFRLPLAPEEAAAPASGPGRATDEACRADVLAGLHVLVVDDEADSRELLERVLAEWGAEVVTAGSTGEALAAIEERRPDLLVSDLGMPGEDGFELIRRVREGETQGRLGAVAVTAFARAEDRERALAAGFDEHVAKPLEVREVVEAVARVAGREG